LQPLDYSGPRRPGGAPIASSAAATGGQSGEWLRGETRSAISDAIVAVYRRFSGRGPTRVKTHFVGNRLLAILEDFLTPIERTLVDFGRDEVVLTLRRSLREEISPYLRSATANLTGRGVAADLGAVHLRPEMAFELFLLEATDAQQTSAVPPGKRPSGSERPVEHHAT
jgi:uncharacterized protein YbcI